MATRGRKHLIVPDCQIKPGLPSLDHITWAAKYAADKKPDVIVLIGDWADMPSLSSYDKGKKSFEGRTYKADIQAANEALELFMAPIRVETERTYKNHRERWNPRLIVTLGNHEERINRTIEFQRELEGMISVEDLEFKKHGFEVYPFLQPITVDGVCYCHYFVSGVKGNPITTARQLLVKGHMSCVAGHQQGKDISWDKRADGTKMVGAIVGSYYQHDEGYLNPQSNNHWRGLLMLHEVLDGSCDEMPVSLSFLKERYS